MKVPMMWCAKTPKGKLILDTLKHTKDEALFELFGHMPESFQLKYWKDIPGSRRGYKELGYKVVRVGILEVWKR